MVEQTATKHKEMEKYINAIDFSLVKDDFVLSNIYKEIGDCGNYLATSPYASTNLERLIMMSSAMHLVPFLKSLGCKVVYKKLGSRIVESIFRRLFECMYIKGEYFALEDAVGMVECAYCICNKDATHALREVIMLLSGRRVDKMYVQKYKMVEKEEGDASNAGYSEKMLGIYKAAFMESVKDIEEDDAHITLLIFLQCTKSQSLLYKYLRRDCRPGHVTKRGYVYEALPTLANKTNLALIYERIKHKIMYLSLADASSYFMAAFARNFREPVKIYRRLRLEDFESNSNVILGLLEALQRSMKYEEIDNLVRNFYDAGDSVFDKLMLGKDNGLDTKYADAIVGFMSMPEASNYGVAADFIRHFKPAWLSTKTGKKLLIGFVSGSSSSDVKEEFLNRNIDLLWNCTKWKKDGRSFIRKVTEFTTGHARKKAFEILGRFQ